MSDIILKNITKEYENDIIINNFSYTFEKGKTYIIKGSSGIGKTTLIKIMLGLTDYKGTILNLDNLEKSCVFQEDRLVEDISVYLNFKMIFSDKIKDKLKEYLKLINLENIENKKVRELSGGMKRRISMLRAILKESDIYFFDEALKEIDETNKKYIMNLLNKLTKDKTIIWITHDDNDLKYFENYEIINLD